MQAVALPGIFKKARLASLSGVIFRLGIACLPLVAVVSLCVIMFSGLGRHKAPVIATQAILAPPAEAEPIEAGGVSKNFNEKKSRISKAAFERLHITRATIRVPD